MVSFKEWSRRRFLRAGSGGLGALLAGVASWAGAQPQPPRGRPRRRRAFRWYRFSCRGRRCSQAAKAHAANRRYATRGAALRDLPHPGAHVRIVTEDIGIIDFFTFFVSRRTRVIDLRHL